MRELLIVIFTLFHLAGLSIYAGQILAIKKGITIWLSSMRFSLTRLNKRKEKMFKQLNKLSRNCFIEKWVMAYNLIPKGRKLLFQREEIMRVAIL